MKHLTHKLAFASTVIVLLAIPPVAPATIVRAVPIVINVCGHGGVRVFTLTEPTPRSLRISDSGTAVLSADDQRPRHDSSGRFRHRSGRELLRGDHGTLTLAWRGERSEDPHRRRLVGTWIVTGGTGAYVGFIGRGEFVSDGFRGSSRYRGVLITAV
jgi:hypothetical protein